MSVATPVDSTSNPPLRLLPMILRRCLYVFVFSWAALMLGSCGEEDDSPTGVIYLNPTDRGELEIDISGLPPSADASVTVTGPREFDESLSGSELFNDAPVGQYSIEAVNVTGGGDTFAPDRRSSTVQVTKSKKTRYSIYFSSTTGNSYDLRVVSAYALQTVQRLDAGVPLVAGRDALLRVFAVSSWPQSIQPDVEISLLDASGTQIQQYIVSASSSTVPTSVQEGQLSQSWNLPLPGEDVVPGLQIVARVDPESEFEEADESNNVFPGDGEPLPLNVRDLNDLQVRFIPVFQSTTNLTGDVDASNMEDFTDLALRLFPTVAIDADLRSTYSTDSRALEDDNAAGSWTSLLGEIRTLQRVEDPSGARHFYGVVDVRYNSGVAGIAYVGGFAGIGRDLAWPGLETVFPHELGHNLGLRHAPCGGVEDFDPNYPYADGTIGVFGMDVAELDLKLPSLNDIMGYCQHIWISDYNYEIAFSHRESFEKREAIVIGKEPEPCYLVRGAFRDGEPRLEPIVELEARAVLPTEGRHGLTLRAADGSAYRLRFEATAIADLPSGSQEDFVFMVPVAALGRAELESVELVSSSGRQARQAHSPRAGDANPRLRRLDGNRILLEWDSQATPLVVVRDADSGEILSLARSGRVEIVTDARAVELHLSDGARTNRRALSIR